MRVILLEEHVKIALNSMLFSQWIRVQCHYIGYIHFFEMYIFLTEYNWQKMFYNFLF